MKNFIPTNVARIIFAITIAFFGLGHITGADQMAGMLAGWPMATALIYISGICLILAAVSFAINKKVKLAGYLLALLLILIVTCVHIPGLLHATDAMGKMLETSMAVKDTAIAMGAIVIANEASN
jgi:uncharacterized membrane protein